MGYQLETTALISIDNYSAFRIRCIMLILEIIKNLGISLECNLDVHLEQK
jgi:hypothetical protein